MIDIPTNDAWVRDYGPTFVSNGSRLIGIDWRYNAWGGKYPPFDDDARVVDRLPTDQIPFERFESTLCLEGGAIEVDGNGILVCTRSCAMDPKRNLISKSQVQEELLRCLGAKQCIWLSGNAIEGDDTDGHIDQLARFAPNDRMLYATCASSDSQFEALNRNRLELEKAIEGLGQCLELVGLPLPSPMTASGRRLPASYCNFYITNGHVIVPTFDAPEDKIAISTINDCFPNREVIGLPSRNLVVGLGSFHCLTQQIPAIGFQPGSSN